MFFGGISENWFLKEFGDIHWGQISDSYNTDSDKLVDSNGNRLYASFVRLKWESDKDLGVFKENDAFKIKSEISRFGNKMFFSEQELIGSRKKIKASLMTVFSSRSANNTTLQKAVPISQIDINTINHEVLPEFAKVFLNAKSNLLGEDRKDWEHDLKAHTFKESSTYIAEHIYEIEPYNDINGVGLLYFASYPIINDKCERLVFNNLLEIENSDWSQLSSCAARDIFYFGNANPQDKLIYRLNNYELVGKNKIMISSSIYRASDNVLISKQFVVRNLIKDWKKHKSQGKDLTEIKAQKKKVVESTSDSIKLVKIDRDKLVQSICIFLSKMLGDVKINGNSDLSLLGIESILFMELSEYLNLEFDLSTNSSKFYGLKNSNEIANSILELEEVCLDEDTSENKIEQNDIAIIATSFKVPGAKNINEFQQLLENGKSAITELPNDRWIWPQGIDLNKSHKGINKGGFIDGIKLFDPSFFNISPVEAELMDPQQRLLLELSWELFERATYKPSVYKGRNIGVFIGASGSDYEQLTYSSDENVSVTGSANALLSNRISYFFDLKGPSKTVDTACSSSLVALHDAVNAIKNGDCTEAIVGGVHLMCNSAKTISYYNSKMLSVDGQCNTFDEKANGYVRAEGAVMFLLKPKKEAIKDHDQILGIIKSTAVNHGGRVSGITVPNPKQQANLVTKALNNAKLSLNDISYIEVHGTGTSLGDPIEINGLNDVAKTTSTIKNSCGLGSVKTNIGHLEAASGLAGVLKVITSMMAKKIPPSINFSTLNKKIDFGTGPFYIQTQLQNWELKKGHKVRFSAVSNFGVGGSNAHVILSSVDDLVKKESNDFLKPTHLLFTLSAKRKEELFDYTEKIKNYLKVNGECDLTVFSRTLQIAKEEMGYRLAFVFSNKEELEIKLNAFVAGKESMYYWGRMNDVEESILDLNVIENVIKGINLAENLNEIAKQWVMGSSVDWNKLNNNNNHKLFDLPIYPFAKEEYWLPQSEKNQEQSSKTDNEITFEPIGNDLQFITNLKNTDVWKDKKNTEFAMSFPSLVKKITEVVNQEKKYALKNVFWTSPHANEMIPNKVLTKIINADEGVFFELSAENNPLFFGELIEKKKNDNFSIKQSEKSNTGIQFSELDIKRINENLQKKTGMLCVLLDLFQDKNNYLGEINFGTGNNIEPDYAEALFVLWTVYKLIKNRIGGEVIIHSDSFYPYFSSELNLNGKLTPVLTFKIVDNDESCDMYFYDPLGVEQLSIKDLNESKMSDACLISN